MNKPLRIVYLHEDLTSVGGAEMLRLTVLSYLLEKPMWRKYIEPTILCLRKAGHLGADLAGKGVRVVELDWSSPLPSALVAARLIRILRLLRPDVVHACMYQGYLHGIIAARLAKCKHVLMEEHNLGSWWMGRREKLFSRLLAAMSTKVIAVSHFHARHLLTARGFPKEKLVVIPNCIDPMRLGGRPGVAGYPPSAARLTSIGSLREVKDYPILLKAFQIILAQYPSCNLSILGDGPKRTELVAFAEALGIAHRVRFHGLASNILDFLAKTDIYVQTGRYESFCISMAEAMYAGCPCVASRAGALWELTDRGEAAILVDPGDPTALAAGVIGILNDVDTRIRLGKNAVDRVLGSYLPQHHIANLMNLYRTTGIWHGELNL